MILSSFVYLSLSMLAMQIELWSNSSWSPTVVLHHSFAWKIDISLLKNSNLNFISKIYKIDF